MGNTQSAPSTQTRESNLNNKPNSMSSNFNTFINKVEDTATSKLETVGKSVEHTTGIQVNKSVGETINKIEEKSGVDLTTTSENTPDPNYGDISLLIFLSTIWSRLAYMNNTNFINHYKHIFNNTNEINDEKFTIENMFSKINNDPTYLNKFIKFLHLAEQINIINGETRKTDTDNNCSYNIEVPTENKNDIIYTSVATSNYSQCCIHSDLRMPNHIIVSFRGTYSPKSAGSYSRPSSLTPTSIHDSNTKVLSGVYKILIEMIHSILHAIDDINFKLDEFENQKENEQSIKNNTPTEPATESDIKSATESITESATEVPTDESATEVPTIGPATESATEVPTAESATESVLTEATTQPSDNKPVTGGDGNIDKPKRTIIINGHSLGGALATLFTYVYMKTPTITNKYNVICVSIGSPRVFNSDGAIEFCNMCTGKDKKFEYYRLTSYNDPVPGQPSSKFGYQHPCSDKSQLEKREEISRDCFVQVKNSTSKRCLKTGRLAMTPEYKLPLKCTRKKDRPWGLSGSPILAPGLGVGVMGYHTQYLGILFAGALDVSSNVNNLTTSNPVIEIGRVNKDTACRICFYHNSEYKVIFFNLTDVRSKSKYKEDIYINSDNFNILMVNSKIIENPNSVNIKDNIATNILKITQPEVELIPIKLEPSDTEENIELTNEPPTVIDPTSITPELRTEFDMSNTINIPTIPPTEVDVNNVENIPNVNDMTNNEAPTTPDNELSDQLDSSLQSSITDKEISTTVNTENIQNEKNQLNIIPVEPLTVAGGTRKIKKHKTFKLKKHKKNYTYRKY